MHFPLITTSALYFYVAFMSLLMTYNPTRSYLINMFFCRYLQKPYGGVLICWFWKKKNVCWLTSCPITNMPELHKSCDGSLNCVDISPCFVLLPWSGFGVSWKISIGSSYVPFDIGTFFMFQSREMVQQFYVQLDTENFQFRESREVMCCINYLYVFWGL
jgi:hypothetical protein